ncbi:Rne/Rng family ribonuclease [Dermatophilus congolensis]|uniref:Rne/Rng family ribonuclease n=1 Tax=Dermatophilus congolensis TaxID=1863 RepID=UPI001AAF73C7|nr:Rne/Rng family ribonuclease [Dermatophilus congolensis]MBO3128899.1 Rne/Rng family ribonuclease [Dermatophilus congolensis]MBO3132463.1 Rne/Rng family ribonuclease [Dermatophilus congolensis]MBO3133376.1 Rne/Rng family ribonuclease [Dermatophilus congolensis]MBO3135611.1 Rne/Rng family ribonuclease [Dermatophilus congolensis]MBO3137850.1 Rne/Rng family ribonuclease [Dermatophilus congolensis]
MASDEKNTSHAQLDEVTAVSGGAAAAPAGASFGLIFQAPDPAAVTTVRRRVRSERVEVTESSADEVEEPQPRESSDDGEDERESRGARRSRRGRRGGRGARHRSEHEGDAELEAPQEDAADGDAQVDVAEAEERQDGADESEPSESRTRRRRRGGRGRRRSLGEDSEDAVKSVDEESSSADEDTDDSSSDSYSDGDDYEGGEDEEGRSSRRRTRRRRRAGSSVEAQDDVPGVTTRVRESRKSRDEATGIKGSTRLEAKRQRRRDGREAGRRRTIITEAQFLARRESVERVMAIREVDNRIEIGVLEDGVLVEHYLSGADGSAGGSSGASSVGNVYLGRVQNVLPSMEAAFVDIGKNRNGVLYAGEVNWDAAGLEGGSQRRIENALSPGQNVLVQVTKDPIGHKGARLTSQVSLPGRFLVYVPDGSMTGISRKLPDTERARLKSLLKKIVPEDAGVIVRTAAEGASEEELTADVKRLARQWETIQKKAASGHGPVLLHGEPGLTVRVVRDIFNEDFSKLVVSGSNAWATVSEYVESVAPDLRDRVTQWTEKADLFATYRIDEQLAKAMDRKVWLPSGGSLIIDRTEAMTVIDVNTGKFVGAGGNLEETVTKNNLEAAEEIVNQLRLRDIGGIIVVDFIDMVLESNRELVVRRLVECLGRDRTKHQVAEVTSLGLVQMTRKRVGAGLIEVFSETCEHCHGRGIIVRNTPKLPSGEPDGEGRKARKGRKGKNVEAPEPKPQEVEPVEEEVIEPVEEVLEESGEERRGVSAAAMAKVAAALKSVPEQVAAEGDGAEGAAPEPVKKRTRRAGRRAAGAPRTAVGEAVTAIVATEPEVVSPVEAAEAKVEEAAAQVVASDAEAVKPEAAKKRTRRAGRRAASAPSGVADTSGVGLMTVQEAAVVDAAPLTQLAMVASAVSDEPAEVEVSVAEEVIAPKKRTRRAGRRAAGAPAGPPAAAGGESSAAE